MSPTLSTGSTEIIPIEDSNNEEEMKPEEQSVIRVCLQDSRISENSVARVRDGQADQGDPLSDTEDVPQPLTEGSQSSRTHSAKPEKFAEINPGKSHLLDIKKKLSAG